MDTPGMYVLKQEDYGLKPGDKVLVTRTAADREAGWQNSWAMHMSNYVGSVCTVLSYHKWPKCGIMLEECPGVWFPYFVLEKVNEESTGSGGNGSGSDGVQ